MRIFIFHLALAKVFWVWSLYIHFHVCSQSEVQTKGKVQHLSQTKPVRNVLLYWFQYYNTCSPSNSQFENVSIQTLSVFPQNDAGRIAIHSILTKVVQNVLLRSCFKLGKTKFFILPFKLWPPPTGMKSDIKLQLLMKSFLQHSRCFECIPFLLSIFQPTIILYINI